MAKKRQSHPVSVLDVAAYILANFSRSGPILAWQMHKIAYFCQIQQLINEGVLLFSEKIIANHKGVMIKELCALHHGPWCIGDSSKGNLNHLSLKQIDTITEVMENTGNKTPEELDVLIQQDPHWIKARKLASHNNEVATEIMLDDYSQNSDE